LKTYVDTFVLVSALTRENTTSRVQYWLARQPAGIAEGERGHFRSAARLVDRHELGLRAGDALPLAIAESRRAAVATLDRGKAAAASALGINIQAV
jgi:hypothetical protein